MVAASTTPHDDGANTLTMSQSSVPSSAASASGDDSLHHEEATKASSSGVDYLSSLSGTATNREAGNGGGSDDYLNSLGRQ